VVPVREGARWGQEWTEGRMPKAERRSQKEEARMIPLPSSLCLLPSAFVSIYLISGYLISGTFPAIVLLKAGRVVVLIAS
jgi:hypothetical protein